MVGLENLTLSVLFVELLKLMAGQETVVAGLNDSLSLVEGMFVCLTENLLRLLVALTGHEAEQQLGGFFPVCFLLC